MKQTLWNTGWVIQQGEPSPIPGMQAKTKEVTLPHDFTIETTPRSDSKNGAATGFYNGGTCTYTKVFPAETDWQGQQVLLHFDGVMGNTKVVVNGHMAKLHHYGYTPFDVDLTPYLYFEGSNRVSVTVSTDSEPAARWYTGSGIYRDVTLLTGAPLHIAPCGLYVHTDHFVEEDAFITVEASVQNRTAEDTCLWVDLYVTEEGCKEVVAQGKIKVFLPACKEATARTQLCIPNVKRWDIDSPNLYTLHARLVDTAAALDAAETIFGVRTVSVDPKYGFRLNGRPLKLKGGCVHHDNGILGAASFKDAEYRRVQLHKQNGYNALRTSHNPASARLLEACDHLGMLVLEEAFDVWHMQKNYYDFSQHFDAEWQQELTAFLLRDRNHPSIFAWSVGNELPEQGNLSRGYETSAMLTEAVRKLDSTRPVSGSLCSFFSGLDDRDTGKFWQSLMSEAAASGGMLNNLDGKFGREIWNDRTEAFAAPWDIVGYNYLNYHYEEAGQLFPNRVICCTESKPLQMYDYWKDVEKYPYLIGDFVWTSMDYIGEAGIGKTLYVEPEQVATAARSLHYARYPWRTAGCGDFDLCGFVRPQLVSRRILWGSRETTIICRDPRNKGKKELLGRYGWPASAPSWSWPVAVGTPVQVEVNSSAPMVELWCNDVSLGKKVPEKNVATYTVPYEKGKLVAISYDERGAEVSRDTLLSGGEPARIKLTGDRQTLPADGQSLCYVTVEVTDREGHPLPYGETTLIATVEGSGTLLALGSARPETEESYTSGTCTSYNGRALAVLRAATTPGILRLKLSSPTLKEATLEIPVEA